jgi:hypothetical protein
MMLSPAFATYAVRTSDGSVSISMPLTGDSRSPVPKYSTSPTLIQNTPVRQIGGGSLATARISA